MGEFEADDYSEERALARAFGEALCADPRAALARFAAPGHSLRAAHLDAVQGDAAVVWQPLRNAFAHFHRRQDLLIAGENYVGEGVWACAVGHLAGVWERPWLGMAPSGRLAFLPFAEFHRVEAGRVAESALWWDMPRLLQASGRDPFPHQLGARLTLNPAPRHTDPAGDAGDTDATHALLDRMIGDSVAMNREGGGTPPADILRRTWHEGMAWYGPAGIGAARGIGDYQRAHQHPFRSGLEGNHFHGHVCRIAQGVFSAWFGWPNLSNTNRGWLGFGPTDTPATMRVVDVYRRDRDRLAENWVWIDLVHYARQHGQDVLAAGKARDS